jgi:glycosyltransferase involved in cell wall biosynthesis
LGFERMRWYSVLRYLRLFRTLRGEIRRIRPDVVISLLLKPNIITLLATVGLGLRIIVSERSVIHRDDIPNRTNLLRRATYRFASGIVVHTAAAGGQMLKLLPRALVEAIPNPVIAKSSALPEIAEIGDFFGEGISANARYLMAMGRLSFEKGFDLLIEAFSLTRAEHHEWRLVILGEGAERGGLEALVRDKGLSDSVALPGAFKNPFPLMDQARLFAMPSRFEGFGNAIVEAMSHALPVVSFNCPDGPAEIICDGVDGVLVEKENPAALAAALSFLMGDEKARLRLGSAAVLSAQRFRMDSILGRWDSLFERIRRQRSARKA